jgi:signal transduction histidine kinase
MRWRRTAVDVLLAALAVAAAASVVRGGGEHVDAVAATSAGALLALLVRRVAPLGACVASLTLLAASLALTPTSTTLQFVATIAAYAVIGTTVTGARLAVAAGAGLAELAFATLVIPTGAGLGDFLLSAFICEGALVLGAVVSRRGRRIARLSAEVELAAERERERSAAALAEERARIARELHDVVSHGLSVVVVQTQAARGALEDGTGGRALDHLGAVESSARDALVEMRRMLGLLQLQDLAPATAPEPPSPGLGELPALVERARAAGLDLRVDLPAELPADTPPVGDGLALAVYRVVQESLTNALKHGSGPASLRVAVGRSFIEVDVVTAPGRASHRAAPAERGGHGLIGMRERVHMYGGRFCAGPEPDGRFGVHARIPVGSVEPGPARSATVAR